MRSFSRRAVCGSVARHETGDGRAGAGPGRSLKPDTLLRMQFYELAIGARFFFRGRRYEKLAMSMARGEDRIGHVFMAETEVTADGEPMLLPPEEAARWKPDGRHWTECLGPAPGQRCGRMLEG